MLASCMGSHRLLLMQSRVLDLPLRGVGAAPQTARVEVAVLHPADRLKRAGLGLAIGLGVSVLALPIPIVHLVLVPGGLIVGVALALRRLGQGETFRGAAGCCPYCGIEQRFTLVGRFRLPKPVYCSSCQRELYLDDVQP
jgi:hypothetical protein